MSKCWQYIFNGPRNSWIFHKPLSIYKEQNKPMLRIALYATRGRRVCCLCNYKHDSLFSLWSHYKHFFLPTRSNNTNRNILKNCLKMSFKWDFSEKTNCSRNEQSLFQQNIPKKMKSIYKHTHTSTHLLYFICLTFNTSQTQQNNKNLRRLNLTHIFAFKCVRAYIFVPVCVYVCECVVKVIKPQQGRFESESAAIQWVRNCADGCATWANTNSQAQIQKINRSVMQTVYVWTTHIYTSINICSQENKQSNRNSRVFFLFLHLAVNYSNYINFIEIRFRTFYSWTVCGCLSKTKNSRQQSKGTRNKKKKEAKNWLTAENWPTSMQSGVDWAFCQLQL